MTHFLSGVTHTRLRQRSSEKLEPNGNLTLNPIRYFTSKIRCAAVVPNLSDVEVWSAEISGELLVRSAVDGSPLHKIAACEEGTYIYSLLYVAPSVYAGFSDGWLRTFDGTTHRLLAEVRAHSGAVNALVAIGDSVFSGGSDWQIIQWKSPQLLRQRLGQLSGHQNAVRCLCTDGVKLFSGGDDCCVRCWDLETGLENSHPWPLRRHTKGVRALYYDDRWLFSAGADGDVHIWLPNGDYVSKLCSVPNTSCNSISLDNAAKLLCLGYSDGVLRLYSEGPHHKLVASVPAHQDAAIGIVQPVKHNAVLKLWCVGSEGTLRSFYNISLEPDELIAVQQGEDEAQTLIDVERTNVLRNYERLDTLKNELKSQRRRRDRSGAVLSQALQRCSKNSVLHNRFSLWYSHMQNEKRTRLGKLLCQSLLWRNQQMMLRVRYHVWCHVSNRRRLQTRKRNTSFLLQTEHGMRSGRAYIVRILEFGNARIKIQRCQLSADITKRSTSKNILLFHFMRWMSFCSKRLRLSLGALSVLSEHALETQNLRIACARTFGMTLRRKYESSKKSCLLVLQMHNERNHLLGSFSFWLKYVQRRKILFATYKKILLLGWAAQKSLVCQYYYRWKVIGIRQSQLKQVLLLTSLEKEFQRNKEMLESCCTLTNEELEEEVTQNYKFAAVARQKLDVANLEESMLNDEHAALQVELLRDLELDTTKAPDTQLEQAIMILKSKGMNFFYNAKDCVAAKEALRKTPPLTLYRDTFAEIRKLLSRVAKPTKLKVAGRNEWAAQQSVLSSISQKSLIRLSAYLCMLLTAFDAMTVQQKSGMLESKDDTKMSWCKEFLFNGELLANFGLISELSTQANKARSSNEARPRRARAARTGNQTSRVTNRRKPKIHKTGGKRSVKKTAKAAVSEKKK